MSQPLIPCPACNRHVFADACECPFCAVKLASDRCMKAHVYPPGYRRMSRAARLAAGAALLGAAACSGSAYGSPPLDDGGRDATADRAEAGPDGATGTGGSGGKGTGGGPGVTPLYGGTAPVPRKPVGES